jgi:hypothetical protein
MTIVSQFEQQGNTWETIYDHSYPTPSHTDDVPEQVNRGLRRAGFLPEVVPSFEPAGRFHGERAAGFIWAIAAWP